MASSTAQRDNPWTNRFQTPVLADLIRPLTSENAALLNTARQKLLDLDGVTQTLAWHGIPWRWTLIFDWPGDTRSLAYLIPQPTSPQIVIPLQESFLAKLPRECHTRHIRDGLNLCASVGSVRWAQWELTSESLLGEVLDLACSKHQLLGKRR